MKLPLMIAAALALVLAATGTASAHKTAYSPDGKIKIVWGFLGEPAVTMTKTGLDLMLSDNATGVPIDGVTSSTLTVEMHKGDEEHQFKDFGAQFGTHGRYTGVITLTQPGIYVLHLAGKINGSDVDMEIEGAHAVEAIEETYFPEMNSTSSEIDSLKATIASMQVQIDALSAKVKAQAETPVPTTTQTTVATKGVPAPAIGALALAGVAVALAIRRRS